MVDARRNLETRGYEIFRLRRAGIWGSLFGRYVGGVKRSEVALFARQIAVMFQAGVGIRRAFQVMSLQGFDDYFSDVIAQVESEVAEGQALSRAMGRHPQVFDMLVVGMVKAAEQAGMLDQVLHRLADYLDKEVSIQQKIKSAITYPLFVFVLSLVLATVIVQHILPTFINGVFKNENLDLPMITKLLVTVTNYLNNPTVLFSLLGGGLVFLFLLRQFFRSAQGKFQLHKFLHATPGFRDVVQTVLAARFCRLFSSLIAAGVPLVHSLELVSAALGDRVVGVRLERAKEDIRNGETLAGALRAMDVFPPIVVEFVWLGEETGRMSEVLARLADFYDGEIDTAVETYTSLLEPMMLLFMGLLVGYVVIACFLPLYQLVSAL